MRNAHQSYLSILVSLVTLVLAACGGGGATGTLSGAKSITQFAIISPAASGNIDEATRNITISVPAGTNVSALVASFISTGKSVAVAGVRQTSGVTANNFTNPVVYTVTAENGSSANYTVTVTAGTPGVDWTVRKSGNMLQNVAWSGTKFVAVGDKGMVFTSLMGAHGRGAHRAVQICLTVSSGLARNLWRSGILAPFSLHRMVFPGLTAP
jgi:type IV secretory pathway TrbF-like protein